MGKAEQDERGFWRSPEGQAYKRVKEETRLVIAEARRAFVTEKKAAQAAYESETQEMRAAIEAAKVRREVRVYDAENKCRNVERAARKKQYDFFHCAATGGDDDGNVRGV